MNTDQVLSFVNQGISLLKTNYYVSSWSDRGAMFLSWNAGAARLLLPPSEQWIVGEMTTAKLVVVTKGMFNRSECYEIMFDDDSGSPFTIYMSVEQSDRQISCGAGTLFLFIVHSACGAEVVLPAVLREVCQLPCLKPWKGPRGVGWTKRDPWGLAHAATRALPEVAGRDDSRLVAALLRAGADPTRTTPQGVARTCAIGRSSQLIEEYLAGAAAQALSESIPSSKRPEPRGRI